MKTTFISIVSTALILSAITVSKTDCHNSNNSNIRDSTQGSPPAIRNDSTQGSPPTIKSKQLKSKATYSDSTQGSPPKKS